MWIQTFLVSIYFLAIQVANPAEGTLFADTVEEIMAARSVWEACSNVDEGYIKAGIIGFVEEHLWKIAQSLYGIISQEDWQYLFQKNDVDDERELLSSYRLYDPLKKGLDQLFAEFHEYCEQYAQDQDFPQGRARIPASIITFGRELIVSTISNGIVEGVKNIFKPKEGGTTLQ